ncbi:MAG: V4R domain-containing protein [archaeon]
MGIVTYALELGERLNLDEIKPKLTNARELASGTLWGELGSGLKVIITEKGEIWVTMYQEEGLREDKSRLKLLTALTAFLLSLNFKGDIGKAISEVELYDSIWPTNVLISNPEKLRSELKERVHIDVFRTLIYSVLFNKMGFDAASRALKEAGKRLGTAIYSQAGAISVETVGGILTKLFRELGLGMLEIEKGEGRNEMLRINMRESLSASGLPPVGINMCYLETGFVEGFFSQFYGKAVSAVEVKCSGMGDPFCVIVVSLYA